MNLDKQPDIDPQETQEWLDALDSVIVNAGSDRAHFLLEQLVEKARRSGAYLPYSATTAYVNTIPTGKEERSPGHPEMRRQNAGPQRADRSSSRRTHRAAPRR